MLILRNSEVVELLHDQEKEVMQVISDAYVRHDEGDTSVPHSVFLRFPDAPTNRIIALPGYLGGDAELAGMKWVSSFPENRSQGRPRASAVVVLNDMATGDPVAMLEGSAISSDRTAASAALAARELAAPDADSLVIVGCGLIGGRVLNYLQTVFPGITSVAVYDEEPHRAEAFAAANAKRLKDASFAVAPDLDTALGSAEMVVFATTAVTPYTGLAACRPGALVLHISLRDILPSAIATGVNVVDDPDHVCRADTSLHLLEQQVQNREFIHGTIGGVLRGATVPARSSALTIYSPFGLGVLDVALADFVRTRAITKQLGTYVADFLP